MKKHFMIIAALAFGVTASAQFTSSNAPAIGDGATLYLLDSATASQGSTNGSGVTWDFSGATGYSGATKTVSIIDPATTTQGGDYSAATVAEDIQDFVTNYNTESSTDRVSQGFVFHHPTLGDIEVTFDGDQENLINYPYDFGDAPINDTYSGNVSLTYNSIPLSGPLTGTSTAEVDGSGTLKLATNTYNNVLRYKLHDSAVATVSVLAQNITVTVIRTTYKYYDLANGNLPIFIYTGISITADNALVPATSYTLVLSKDAPGSGAGLSLNNNNPFKVFPNPSSSLINIELPNNIDNANISITDNLGRTVYTSKMGITKTINVSSFNKGIYFVKIENDNYSSVRKIIVK